MTDTRAITAINKELRRLKANSGGDGIEVKAGPTPNTATFFDTQVTATYDADSALQALRNATAEGWEGGGFEAAWQALALLPEYTPTNE